MKKEKRGISLIVLVITIIVMIVLATAIILSLNSSGIIGRSREAKFLNDVANIRDKISLEKAEKILEDGEAVFTAEEKEEILGDYAGVLAMADDGTLSAGEEATDDQKEQLASVGIGESSEGGSSEGGNNSEGNGDTSGGTVGEPTTAALSDWDFYLRGTDIVLQGYNGTATDIIVPATYYVSSDDYYGVEAGTFTAGTYNVKAQSGGGSDSAFGSNTTITSVEISDGAEFGYYTDSEWINDLYDAFSGCTSLISIVNLPVYVDGDVGMWTPFSGCSNLAEVKFASDVFVESINNYYTGDDRFRMIFGTLSKPLTVYVPSSSTLAGQTITYTVWDGNATAGTLNIVGY